MIVEETIKEKEVKCPERKTRVFSKKLGSLISVTTRNVDYNNNSLLMWNDRWVNEWNDRWDNSWSNGDWINRHGWGKGR